ncbi:hypothetical protein SAMD00079811_57750 [Scytonema sp. HK-05]|uniref:KGK domain-containing protein n=1 Tax=Scytonema sp. HK-05 TaxID=1137095 RepID=UPI000937C421|nr:KGK domain-containing protein [Scytonema sp. HK-05]OKH58849.1 hypothetical protein NIES2130_12175 [Scytonema sp. HK-05]BAY48155.1 hypothetical protein SAMD00079811_57750 [Scytonema sp. HK-05]
MLPNQLKRLEREDDVILLENKIFNAVQIVNQVLQDFEPKGNDLNFCCKDKFLKKYFKKRNVQGIFNRVEWQFSLRRGIQCELLLPGNNGRQKGKLEIRITLDFSPSKKQFSSMSDGESMSDSLSITDSKSSKNFEIKVSLDFCPDEMISTEMHDQNSLHFYSSNSEEIYVPMRPILMPNLWENSSRN